MDGSLYSTSDSSTQSFVQINEEDVEPRPPLTESQVIKCEIHDIRGEWPIKTESEFNTHLYDAGRVATIGIFGPHQSGKTTLVNSLSKRTISSTNVSASTIINEKLQRTVFVEAWQGYCRVSHNNASPSYATFFLDTPGHPQQLHESIYIWNRLKTAILVINISAGLQYDHIMYLNALEERLLALRKSSYKKLQFTCILAFSNIDKFCYEEVSRVRRRNTSQCCLIQYISLRIHLQIESIKASICKERPWLKTFLSHQTLLCYYNCMKKYCLTSNHIAFNSTVDSFTIFESIVTSLLNGTNFIPDESILCMLEHVNDQSPITVNSDTIKTLYVCCCPYKVYPSWSAYIFYTPSPLASTEIDWKHLLGRDFLGPLIEESDRSLKKLSIVPADTVFIMLIQLQSNDRLISCFVKNTQNNMFYPYTTHIQLPIALVSDTLQFSTYLPGFRLQPTSRPDIFEIRSRGEYTVNLFLSIFQLIVQKFLINKVPKQGQSTIKTLPLLPVLKKYLSHASQSPSQLKVYLDKSHSIISFTISILLREAPPPQTWGYKLGLQKRTELLSTMDPTVSVYHQIATLYATSSYTITDGTIHCEIVDANEGIVLLTSQLSHTGTLVDALKEAVRREEESSLICFHNLQIIVLDCKFYQKAQSIGLHTNTLLANAIASSKLHYMDAILYVQIFITIRLYHTKKEQSFLNDALEKLRCLLCSRRCTFATDPWIHMGHPIPSLATIFCYIPAGSALGLEMAIEHVIRCTSVNIYHDGQVYFTRAVNAMLDKDDLKGTVDAMKSRFSIFN